MLGSRFGVLVWSVFGVVACRGPATETAVATPPPLAPDQRAAGAGNGELRELPDGITVRQVRLDRRGGPMDVWMYRRAGAAGRLPVVLIGAAGSPLFTGVALSEGDRPEHMPWAKHGYAVVAYSIDGAAKDGSSEPQIVVAVRAFLDADAGLENAKAALEYALAHERDLDAERVYAVGHSSAGTIALRVGAELPRVKAIVAFNAPTDVIDHLAPYLPELDKIDGRASRVLRASSPRTHLAALQQKPVLLFHSAEDRTVPSAESEFLAEALKPWAPGSRLLVVPAGDHYNSMLEEGIPAAIEWLGARSGLAGK